MTKAIVIGAGVGGLCAAASLAARGCSVRVFERAAAPGGKMRLAQAGAAAIDAGPTVLTMRWVFETLFDEWGLSLRLPMRPLSVLARHAWSAEERLDLFADPVETEAAIGAFAGSAEALNYRAFRAEASRIFAILRKPFIERPKPNLPQLLWRIGLHRVADQLAMNPYQTLYGALSRRFRDPRLRQLFARYATYAGSSPYRCPATLMLIAHAEQEGVWSVDGGMHALARAVEAAATALGVEFHYNAEVEAIEVAHGRVSAVRLADGSRHPTNLVIFNGDPEALGSGLLGQRARRAVPRARPARRSLSACTFAWFTPSHGFPLLRHNVFFSPDYRAEFDGVFEGSHPPRAPTVYVCAQDRDDGATQHSGPERLLLVINAPPNGDRTHWTAKEIDACETSARQLLERCGLNLPGKIQAADVATPQTFAQLFPGTGGAIYGQASHGWRASFRRPGAETALPGLFLAGGGTHPGAGVPMAALSGRLAAEAAWRWQARLRTFRSSPAAADMSGGMSTPSAQTAPLD